eukprot:scaffold234842_cov14-Tisochrysis_lutea.AAC.1
MGTTVSGPLDLNQQCPKKLEAIQKQLGASQGSSCIAGCLSLRALVLVCLAWSAVTLPLAWSA